MFTMGDVAMMSMTKTPVQVFIEKPNKGEEHYQIMRDGEDLLYKLFGINAELLIDHAWGYEPVTVDYIKQYRPESNSLGSGQVLHRPYKYEEAKIIVREMADDLSLELLRKGIATAKIELYIGFDRESLVEENGRYKYKDDPQGRFYKGKDEDVQKAAQTDDQQVYHRSVFPGIFDETAMAAYMENQEAYIQLFQDAKKYHAVQAALADMLYRDLHDKKS